MGPLIRPSEVDRVENWVTKQNIMDVKSLLEEIKSNTCFDKTILVNLN